MFAIDPDIRTKESERKYPHDSGSHKPGQKPEPQEKEGQDCDSCSEGGQPFHLQDCMRAELPGA